MTGMEHAIEKAAGVMDKNFNPDRYPIMAAMFRDYARALAEAGLLAPAPLREEALADEPEPWRCPGCNSDRWIRASLTQGLTVITQCVPCGRYVNCPPPGRAEGDGRADQ